MPEIPCLQHIKNELVGIRNQLRHVDREEVDVNQTLL